MIEKTGIAASPGIAIGKAFIYAEEEYIVPKYNISEKKINSEINRFNKALNDTKEELALLQETILEKAGKERADFFNLHLLILEDPILVVDVKRYIKKNKRNVEWALELSIGKHIDKLSMVEDTYIRERVVDLYDIARRMMRHLLQKQKDSLANLPTSSIVVAHDLAPSDTVTINKRHIFGIITDMGGSTSHTAILSRAIGIPAVVGLDDITKNVKSDDILIIDGNQGKVIVGPTEEVLKHYKTAKTVYEKYSKTLLKLSGLAPITTDKHKVKVLGNIEILEEIHTVMENGGVGIGLFRTEFQYLNKSYWPEEDELYKTYNNVAKIIKPHSVTIRTIDVGGDKLLKENMANIEESNPFLGWRAVRFCLENEDIFRTQLRAIIRASKHCNVNILVPMISSVEEIRKVKVIIEDIKTELSKKNIKFDKNIWVGSMVEIPAAAITADLIMKEVDFVSIGTNDLVQYTIAVDRNNQKIAYLYDNFHPGVLRLIKNVVNACRTYSKCVHVCGEMASDPMACVLLVGLGVNELSMAPNAIPEIKKIIRSISYAEARKIATEVMQYDTAKQVRNHLREFLLNRFPGIFEKIFTMYV